MQGKTGQDTILEDSKNGNERDWKARKTWTEKKKTTLTRIRIMG